MEGNSETSPRAPLLSRRPSENGRWTRSLSRKNSVNSLRTEFYSRLNDKVRDGLDVESSPHDIDLSRTKGLSSGPPYQLCLVTEKMRFWKSCLLLLFLVFLSHLIFYFSSDDDVAGKTRWVMKNQKVLTFIFRGNKQRNVYFSTWPVWLLRKWCIWNDRSFFYNFFY